MRRDAANPYADCRASGRFGMNDGLSFVSFMLSLTGALTVFCGGAYVLISLDKEKPDSRLTGLWRCVAGSEWSRLIGDAQKMSLRWMDIVSLTWFEFADKKPALDLLYIGLVFVFVPFAAAVNALLGGSPFLLQAYLVMLTMFAVLVVTSQLNTGNGLLAFINATLSLFLGLGLFFGAPLYVLASFTDRILHENISHAFLLSLLICPFYYITAFSFMNYVDSFFGRNPITGRTPVVVFFHRFLAVVPVAFLLVFLALLLGQLAVKQTVPPRTIQMFIFSVSLSAFSLPATICALSPTLLRGGLVGSISSLLNGLVTAMGVSIALLYLSYLSTPNELSLAEIVNVLFGLDTTGERVFLGPDFWVMHIPFLPVLGVLVFCLVSIVAKSLTRVPGLQNKPYLAMAGLLGLLGVGLFISGRVLVNFI